MPEPFPNPWSGLASGLSQGISMGINMRQQMMAQEQMEEQKKRQAVDDAYRAADMLTKMDLPEEISTKLFQKHIIPTLNASYGMNIPTDTQWQPTHKKYLKQITTIAQNPNIFDADKPAMIKAAVAEAAAKGKDISSEAKPLLADIEEKLNIEAQYGMLPRTPSITQGMVTAPPSELSAPATRTMGLAERYKMPESSVTAQPLADVAPISKEMLSRLPASMRQKMVEAARPDLFGGEKEQKKYIETKADPNTGKSYGLTRKGNWEEVPMPKGASFAKPDKGDSSKSLQEKFIEWKEARAAAGLKTTSDDVKAYFNKGGKEFGERFNEWKASFKDNMKRNPTQEEIRAKLLQDPWGIYGPTSTPEAQSPEGSFDVETKGDSVVHNGKEYPIGKDGTVTIDGKKYRVEK